MNREEVARIAREKIGVTARMVGSEYGVLARRLEPGERIRAMAIGKHAEKPALAAGVLIVATDRRLMTLAKTFITRRERVEEFRPERLRGARVEPVGRMVLHLHDGERAYSLVTPASQLAELTAFARGEPASRFGELDQLARRKLGRILGFGIENEILVLAEVLQPDESVLDLAWDAKEPSTLIAVCPQRLILVPQQRLRQAPAPTTVVRYADGERIAAEGDALVVGTTRFEELLPQGAAQIIATRIAAVSPGSGPRP